jgi:hypothetical protein
MQTEDATISRAAFISDGCRWIEIQGSQPCSRTMRNTRFLDPLADIENLEVAKFELAD